MSETENQKTLVLLVADDDPDDRFLIEEALGESEFIRDMRSVEDGEELMDYLHQRGKYEDPRTAPQPHVILLDLNMPKKDGRQALQEIKQDQRLRHIPIIILTTSKAEEDIIRSYDLGVNSFITKPVRFDDFVETMRTFGKYWFKIVELPRESHT